MTINIIILLVAVAVLAIWVWSLHHRVLRLFKELGEGIDSVSERVLTLERWRTREQQRIDAAITRLDGMLTDIGGIVREVQR